MEHVAPEAGDDGLEACRARRDGPVREHVGIDGRDAELREPGQTIGLAGGDAAGERHPQQAEAHVVLAAGISASVSVAGVMRSSTNVFHSWQCGHCQSSSVLR